MALEYCLSRKRGKKMEFECACERSGLFLFASVLRGILGPGGKYPPLRIAGAGIAALSCAWTWNALERQMWALLLTLRWEAFLTPLWAITVNTRNPAASSPKVKLPHGCRKPLQPEKCRTIQKQFERRAGIQHPEYFIKILLVFAQAGHMVPAGPGGENATLIWISLWTSLPTMHWQGFKCDAWL